jgi:hypothetical protein
VLGLYPAAGGVPETLLESWNLSNTIPLAPTIVTLNSTSHPTLLAGQQYWITAGMSDPNSRGVWWINNFGVSGLGTSSLNGGPFFSHVSNPGGFQAFDVVSTLSTSITPGPVTTATAAVVEANANGDTIANLRGLAPTDAPTLQDQIQMIVQQRVIQNPSTDVTQLTTQLVKSLPSNILPPSQAANMINAVVKQVVPPDKTPPVTTATPSPGPNVNGWNNTNVTVTFNSTDNEPNGTGVKQITVTLIGAQSGSVVIPGGTGAVQITTDGITVVTYFGTDNAGNQETPKTLAVQIDKTPPVISGMPAAGCTLWPPNHRFVQVATVTAADALSGLAPGAFKVTGASNEPIASADPMSTDIVITQTSPTTFTVQLRAERLGKGTGRVYTLNATASDLAANTATSTATCIVPHDQGK